MKLTGSRVIGLAQHGVTLEIGGWDVGVALVRGTDGWHFNVYYGRLTSYTSWGRFISW